MLSKKRKVDEEHRVLQESWKIFDFVAFFCPLLSNLFPMYADLGKNKIKLID